jgi:hypothetical protein
MIFAELAEMEGNHRTARNYREGTAMSRGTRTVWRNRSDARAAAEALARHVCASDPACPDPRWSGGRAPDFLSEIIQELDPRIHRWSDRRTNYPWRERSGAFYDRLKQMLGPALYTRVCVVLFDAIEQSDGLDRRS